MRKSRIYSLHNMVASPGKSFYDKVFYYPKISEPIHMWLLSPCSTARIRLDEYVYTPKMINELPNKLAVDYGIFVYPVESFGQLRIDNISVEDLKDSFLVITPLLDWKPCGEMDEIERSLWGLSKHDAGISVLTPAATPVGEATEFCVRYYPNIKLPAGSTIRFGIPYAFAYPQAENCEEDGFIFLGGTFLAMRLKEIGRGSEGHERVYIFFELEEDLNAEEMVEVHYRTSNVYLYPQCYSENEMEFWYTRSPVLNVSVALPEREDFVFLDDLAAHRSEFLPGRIEKLHLFMPGRRHSGEKIVLHGLFTDKYNNINLKARSNLCFNLYVQYENEKYLLNNEIHYNDFCSFYVDILLNKEGVYRILAVDKNGNILAESNPCQLLSQEDPRPNIYWGDIHVHSGMSDGIGEYRELFEFGRDISSLDFVAAADHACYFSDNEWEIMQDICNSFNCDDHYTTLVAYEWAGKQVHRNIYTSENRLKLFRGMYKPTSTLDKVYNFFHGRSDIVAGPHGSIAHGLRFQYHDPTIDANFAKKLH